MIIRDQKQIPVLPVVGYEVITTTELGRRLDESEEVEQQRGKRGETSKQQCIAEL